jgi:hypothetical protein
MSTILFALTLTACGSSEPTEPAAPAPVVEEPKEEPKEEVVADAGPGEVGDFDAAGLYTATCAPCHGETGAGDGPAGAALTPKAASFAGEEFWAERDNDHMRKVIKEGGAAVGKSPIMAPFGASFENDAQVDALIEHLKTFK